MSKKIIHMEEYTDNVSNINIYFNFDQINLIVMF